MLYQKWGRRVNEAYEQLNAYLVGLFNHILRIEEDTLEAYCPDLSVHEMHTIEAALTAKDNSMGAIAERLAVTPGTLSVAVRTLENKGYIERYKDEKDRRQVLLRLTEQGEIAHELHQKFHQSMVDAIIEKLSAAELPVFIKAIGAVDEYFTGLDTMNDIKDNKQ